MPAVTARGRGRRTVSEINMVPFIDVMLVLLIIFMVTAPLIAPSVIDLPSIGKAAKQADRVVQVMIGKDEMMRVRGGTDANGEVTVSLAQLPQAVTQRVKAASADGAATPVVIAADRNVRYEAVVKVMDSLQKSGVARFGLSVQLGAAP